MNPKRVNVKGALNVVERKLHIEKPILAGRMGRRNVISLIPNLLKFHLFQYLH